MPRDPALGFVGDVAAVNPSVIERLVTREIIPVVSSIGADEGGQAYNINADTMAAALAGALGAAKVVYLTDVPVCSPILRTRPRWSAGPALVRWTP